MKLLFYSTIALALLVSANTASALTDIVPGNYRGTPAYDDYLHDIDPSASACLYILGAPDPNGIFAAQLVFDGTVYYNMGCTRLSTGGVRERNGIPKSTVKEDRSPTVLCTGPALNSPGYTQALTFKSVGKEAKAKLKKAQVVFNDGANVVFADFVQDSSTCVAPIP